MERVFLNMDKIYSDCIFVKDILLASRERRLHSVSSIQPSFIRFINQTNTLIKIYWLDYEGNTRFYNMLQPEEFLDVNTFATHLWVFEDAKTGDRLVGGGKTVFQAEPWFGNGSRRIVESRKEIPIRLPLYSLKTRAMQVVRNSLSSSKDIDQLEIPESLKKELKCVVKKKVCYFTHGRDCNCSWETVNL